MPQKEGEPSLFISATEIKVRHDVKNYNPEMIKFRDQGHGI